MHKDREDATASISAAFSSERSACNAGVHFWIKKNLQGVQQMWFGQWRLDISIPKAKVSTFNFRFDESLKKILKKKFWKKVDIFHKVRPPHITVSVREVYDFVMMVAHVVTVAHVFLGDQRGGVRRRRVQSVWPWANCLRLRATYHSKHHLPLKALVYFLLKNFKI